MGRVGKREEELKPHLVSQVGVGGAEELGEKTGVEKPSKKRGLSKRNHEHDFGYGRLKAQRSPPMPTQAPSGPGNSGWEWSYDTVLGCRSMGRSVEQFNPSVAGVRWRKFQKQEGRVTSGH